MIQAAYDLFGLAFIVVFVVLGMMAAAVIFGAALYRFLARGNY